MKNLFLTLFITTSFCFGQSNLVNDFKITILSTMLSDTHIGEWGFSALVEVDGEKILFDTGSRPNTVFQNAIELNIDLSNIKNVYLSHNHKDHTGGLLFLKTKYPNSFVNAHVGEGIFYSRPNKNGGDHYLLKNKNDLIQKGVKFIFHKQPNQIIPKVWTTGQIPREYDEKNWSQLGKLIDQNGNIQEDIIPEDQSLFFDTKKGIVLISGCGHAGIINTLEYVSKIFPNRPIYKILGGFHLLKLDAEKLKWTADKMKSYGVDYFVGAHCTGINSTYMLREFLDSTKNRVLIGSVGTYITPNGIIPGYME
jgi:7,8-dihydropterin-6-yl-methyl-4-(beta-D-ribofuranosyl)aminobenzene 5'-phosphate synthase